MNRRKKEEKGRKGRKREEKGGKGKKREEKTEQAVYLRTSEKWFGMEIN